MKNKLPLVIAVVIAIAAILAIKSYVGKVQQQAANQLRGLKVVAASRDIPAGSELQLAMLTAMEVPRQFIPAQSIQGSDQVREIIGRKTATGIKKGQMILWSDLQGEMHGGLATLIPIGEEAYTAIIGKGIKPGLLQPSDHVDIIGSFAAPKPNQPLAAANIATWRQASDMVNVVLLQNVTILAIGENMNPVGRPEGSSTGSELTLALTLPEAQLLMFASEHGELGAVLRKEGATEVTGSDAQKKITFENVQTIIGDLDGIRNTRLIEVQKGQKSVSIPVANPSPDRQ